MTPCSSVASSYGSIRFLSCFLSGWRTTAALVRERLTHWLSKKIPRTFFACMWVAGRRMRPALGFG